MAKNESRVLVIGAGPCGLLGALLLARQGVPVLVVDEKDGPSEHPRAMGITRRTAEIYREIGLLKRMKKEDLTADDLVLSICMRSLAGEEYGRTALSESSAEFTPCEAFHCPQPHTEKVLLRALEKEPLAKIRFRTRLTRLEEMPGDGVEVQTESAERGNETFRVPWVIAADGAGSTIRHQLGIDAAGPGDMGHFLNVYFEAPYGPRLVGRHAVLYHCVSPEYAEFFVSVDGGNRWLMHHFLTPGETPEDWTEEKLTELIRKASGFADIAPRILSVNKWVMSPKVAESFRKGHILLMGDAASRLSPSGGLGMNTGLQSAHNLAWKLAAVIQGRAGEGLLDTYEQERRTFSLHMMHTTNKNSMEVYAIVEAALANDFDKVRELASHSRRAGSGLGRDIGYAYEVGAFLPDGTTPPANDDPENNYIPNARPGCRAPHFWLKRRKEKLSSLDLFGNGWVLIAGSNPCAHAWKQAARQCEVDIKTYLIGEDISCDEEAVEKLYGITQNGMVLVRPDGIVALRSPAFVAHPHEFLEDELKKILCLD